MALTRCFLLQREVVTKPRMTWQIFINVVSIQWFSCNIMMNSVKMGQLSTTSLLMCPINVTGFHVIPWGKYSNMPNTPASTRFSKVTTTNYPHNHINPLCKRVNALEKKNQECDPILTLSEEEGKKVINLSHFLWINQKNQIVGFLCICYDSGSLRVNAHST